MPNIKIIPPAALLLLLVSGAFHAAFAGPVEVQSIHVVPAETRIGVYPDITGDIKVNEVTPSGGTLEVTVVAVVVRPDHVIKSWIWKHIDIKAGEVRTFVVPREYGVVQAGTYKVDFNVYTRDMKPLHMLSRNFVVFDPSLAREKAIVPGGTAGQAPAQPAEYPIFGAGLYANTLNPAGGAMMLLWPLTYVGLEGSYTEGTFTSAEGRLLVRYPLSSGINPYAGVGYLSVSTERTVDVIGVKTKFRDSAVSGVIGAEIPLSRSIYGYVEMSGANIDLKQTVTNGTLTGTATVKYIPVTVGLGIAYYLF